MRLNSQQLTQIQAALLSAFPSRDELSMLARYELDVNLEEVASGQNLRVIVFNFLTWAESNGRIIDLVNGACRQNPGNTALQKLQEDLRAWPALGEAAPIPDIDPAKQHKPAEIDIFLSYSRHNTELMRRLHADLHDAGFSVWTDEGLEAGTPSWKAAVEEAVRQARCMVVILSPESKTSEWVNNEIGYAAQFRRRIFPVLASGEPTESVPIDLVNAQWVDVRQDYKRNVDEGLIPALTRHIHPDESPKSEIVRVPKPFPRWIVAGLTAIIALGVALYFIWSIWSRPVTVPLLRGLAVNDAVATLVAVGLHSGSITEGEGGGVAPGRVAASTPAPGDAVARASTVDLIVAAAPTKTPTFVPVPTSTPAQEPARNATATAIAHATATAVAQAISKYVGNWTVVGDASPYITSLRIEHDGQTGQSPNRRNVSLLVAGRAYVALLDGSVGSIACPGVTECTWGTANASYIGDPIRFSVFPQSDFTQLVTLSAVDANTLAAVYQIQASGTSLLSTAFVLERSSTAVIEPNLIAPLAPAALSENFLNQLILTPVPIQTLVAPNIIDLNIYVRP